MAKIIVILGPTASGKSALAVNLAKKFKGEVISADSRQVYKGMDIGTAKIGKKEMKGVPHHLLSIASPKRKLTVVRYRELALRTIKKVLAKGKLPILCGGTGFYIQAVIDGLVIPHVKPDRLLRIRLNKLKTEELFKKLKKLDPRRAKSIDKGNKRRLIRALEIVYKTKKPVPSLEKKPLPCPVLLIGLKKDLKELEKLIKRRFSKWLKEGFLREVLKLRKLGLSWKKIEEFGVHYRTASHFLQKKTEKEQFIEKSLIELKKYAKRQITWWKQDKRIHWIKKQPEAEKLIKEFL